MSQSRAQCGPPIADLLAQRWSPRAFDPQRPVPETQQAQLLEAARWAPSCFNDQPWRVLLWDRFADAAHWELACSCLVPGNQAWAKAAPLLLATVASSKFAANGSANRWAQYDTGAAALAVALQASALSLQAHQMGGFDTERLRQSFAIPAGYEPMAMMAIGYPGAPAQLSEKSQLTETKPRERRAIETFAYRGRWGLPWT